MEVAKHQLQPKSQKQHHHQKMLVDLLNGLVTTTVMMKTTMRIVVGMVEIAVETMSTPNTALLVNA